MNGFGKILNGKFAIRLYLLFCWSLWCGVVTFQKCDTVETLWNYLAHANIWLRRNLADPINRYIAKENGIVCDRCDTRRRST